MRTTMCVVMIAIGVQRRARRTATAAVGARRRLHLTRRDGDVVFKREFRHAALDTCLRAIATYDAHVDIFDIVVRPDLDWTTVTAVRRARAFLLGLSVTIRLPSRRATRRRGVTHRRRRSSSSAWARVGGITCPESSRRDDDVVVLAVAVVLVDVDGSVGVWRRRVCICRRRVLLQITLAIGRIQLRPIRTFVSISTSVATRGGAGARTAAMRAP
mmetsp:Transcript_5748/g.20811  ORF Transcript_5748/g.20811 Transcript_5748/m.20811 type:complete len:215 (-) Transcript_5748:1130-1774(-)